MKNIFLLQSFPRISLFLFEIRPWPKHPETICFLKRPLRRYGREETGTIDHENYKDQYLKFPSNRNACSSVGRGVYADMEAFLKEKWEKMLFAHESF